MRPARGWGHAHRTAGEHGSGGGCVRRRRASDGCPGSARSEGTAGGADSGCEPTAAEFKSRGRGRGVVWPGRSQGGPLSRVKGEFPSVVVWESSVTPASARADSRVGSPVSPEGPGLGSPGLHSHCEDSQTDRPPAVARGPPTPCKPPADGAERGLQGPEPPRARRWGEAGVPAFCRSRLVPGGPGT